MSDALVFREVSKSYGRGAVALDGFSCRFPRGSLCGLVGPNGAGKTTAFSLVCGFLGADAGQVEVLGEPGFDPFRLKGRLGVLPQDADLGLRHTPMELLVHHARLQGLRRAAAVGESERVLGLLHLADRRNRRIGSLSHGMRRRVAVASALVGQPELVMLDEPTSGLDPVQARDLRDALAAKRAAQTVIVCSHNLAELERLCDWVVMMDRGRCVRQGTLAEVTGTDAVVVWTLGPGAVPLARLAEVLPGHGFRVRGVELEHRVPDGDLDSASIEVAAVLAAARVPIREVRRGVSLEQTFFADAGAQSPSSGGRSL